MTYKITFALSPIPKDEKYQGSNFGTGDNQHFKQSDEFFFYLDTKLQVTKNTFVTIYAFLGLFYAY